MAAWEVPILLAAAVMGVNKWVNKKLRECEEKEAKQKEAEKRYQILADGVVPDLYQFYQEMDGVIERLGSKEKEQQFCDNMDKLVEFMCTCKEPGGVPTVQNILMTAMSAKNCGMDFQAQASSEIAKAFGEHLMGEIKRTSVDQPLTEQALLASAKLIEAMFLGKASKPSARIGPAAKGGRRA